MPLSDFYKHPRMADGHLNKCKVCTKKDVKKDYDRKSKDAAWVERERLRGREKYQRLGYKDKYFCNKTQRELHPICVRRKLKKLNIDVQGKEAHHWNYNKPKSVILLSRKAHHVIHRNVIVSREDRFLHTLDGLCLDTEEKTISYYTAVLDTKGIKGEDLRIINL